MRSVRDHLSAYRLTAIGVPLLGGSAFLVTQRLGYTIIVTLISAACLLVVDSQVRDIVEEPEDDEL